MGMLAVLHAAQLVTLAGAKRPRVGHEMHDLSIIEGGGMLIRDGTIAAVGTSDEIARNMPDEGEVADARGRVVLPGNRATDRRDTTRLCCNRLGRARCCARGWTIAAAICRSGDSRHATASRKGKTSGVLRRIL